MGSMTMQEYWKGDDWAWHYFDVGIVFWSCIFLIWDVPPQFAALKTLRVLRIFVLFHVIPALNQTVR